MFEILLLFEIKKKEHFFLNVTLKIQTYSKINLIKIY